LIVLSLHPSKEVEDQEVEDQGCPCIFPNLSITFKKSRVRIWQNL